MQDVWKKDYPQIASKPAILGTLYNIGSTKTHGNPKSNEFGRYVKKFQKNQKMVRIKNKKSVVIL